MIRKIIIGGPSVLEGLGVGVGPLNVEEEGVRVG